MSEVLTGEERILKMIEILDNRIMTNEKTILLISDNVIVLHKKITEIQEKLG